MTKPRRGRPETKQGGGERALKVDLPAELKTQLKVEAVELDMLVRDYVREILEERLPRHVRQRLRQQAEKRGTTYQELILQALRDVRLID